MNKRWVFLILFLIFVGIMLVSWSRKEGLLSSKLIETFEATKAKTDSDVVKAPGDYSINILKNYGSLKEASIYILEYLKSVVSSNKRIKDLYATTMSLKQIGSFSNNFESDNLNNKAYLYSCMNNGLDNDFTDLYLLYNNCYSIVKFNNKSLGRIYGISNILAIGFLDNLFNDKFSSIQGISMWLYKFSSYQYTDNMRRQKFILEKNKNKKKNAKRGGKGNNISCYFEVLVSDNYSDNIYSFTTDFGSMNEKIIRNLVDEPWLERWNEDNYFFTDKGKEVFKYHFCCNDQTTSQINTPMLTTPKPTTRKITTPNPTIRPILQS